MSFKTVAALIAAIHKYGKRREKEDGTFVTTLFLDSDRYHVDYAADRQDWVMYSTADDASYFGVWLDSKNYRTLAYTEGDWTLHELGTPTAYNTNLGVLDECYQPGHEFSVIDRDTGALTRYTQDRNELLIPTKD